MVRFPQGGFRAGGVARASLHLPRMHWPQRTPVVGRPRIFLIYGRRSGKSQILALVAVWLACFITPVLGPGERGTIFIVASARRQARTILRYYAP